MPFDRGPCLARPRRPVRRLGLEGPFADQRLEPLERLLCGWLVHRVAPPSDCSGNLIPTRYPHVNRLVWHHSSLRPFPSMVAKRCTVQPLVHADFLELRHGEVPRSPLSEGGWIGRNTQYERCMDGQRVPDLEEMDEQQVERF